MPEFSEEHGYATALASIRWPDGLVCRNCEGREFYRIHARPRVFECKGCGRQYSVTAGTALHGTHLRLSAWFRATERMCVPNTAAALAAELGVTYETAFQAYHRLRWVLAPAATPLPPPEESAVITTHHHATCWPWRLRPDNNVTVVAAQHPSSGVIAFGVADVDLRARQLARRGDPNRRTAELNPAKAASELLRDTFGSVSLRWIERYLAAHDARLRGLTAVQLRVGLIRAPRTTFAQLGPYAV